MLHRRSFILSLAAFVLTITGFTTLLSAYLNYDSSADGPPAMSINHELFYIAPPLNPIKPPPKYYAEPSVRDPGKKNFHDLHYDKRFFQRELSVQDREHYIREMLGAWFQFNEDNNLQSWIAHGTLLGWWWNSEPLPWDVDVDIQMFVRSMQQLANGFNDTVYTFTNETGHTLKYYIDVNPYYVYRSRSNGMNVIDGRFIDMQTGLYIDMTALAEADPIRHPNIVSCKNNHKYLIDDLVPLRRTVFIGKPVYIPYEYEKVLQKEYSRRALTNGRFQKYVFSVGLQKWIPEAQFNKEHRPWNDIGRGPATAPSERMSSAPVKVAANSPGKVIPGAHARASSKTEEDTAETVFKEVSIKMKPRKRMSSLSFGSLSDGSWKRDVRIEKDA
ncbi:LicD family-domain-containing protein [Myxozyma melibiosi]|uniref:LicD family-domain-containing protein n=1 Tax=Myxozyma melibiosi TaxID=54550 RepID=A0ABR1FFB8_9ASCO